jgi:hypothetical protein
LEKVLAIFCDTVESKGTAVPPLDNLVGPAVPSVTAVPMIFHRSIKTTTTSVQVLVPSPK